MIWDQTVLSLTQAKKWDFSNFSSKFEGIKLSVPVPAGGNISPLLPSAHLVPVPEHSNAGAGVGVTLLACPHQNQKMYFTVMIIYFCFCWGKCFVAVFFDFKKTIFDRKTDISKYLSWQLTIIVLYPRTMCLYNGLWKEKAKKKFIMEVKTVKTRKSMERWKNLSKSTTI